MEKRETPVTRWLRSNRGGTSQAALVADLELVTGWKLLRENYSKYETGALSPEPETLARFVAYWAAKGKPGGPDFTPPPPVLSFEERQIEALNRQATAIADLVVELRAWRTADRDRIGGLEQTMLGVLAAVGPIERGAEERRTHGALPGSAG